MAWIKVPAEHHPLFLAAVPKDRRVTTIRMFGGTAALINGHIFAGLFARSAIVRLSPDDQRIALALEGAGLFDPMGNGRTMADTVLLPEDVIDDADELRSWLDRALAFAATKPPKPPKGLTKPAYPRPTAKPKPASLKAARPAKPATPRATAKPATPRATTKPAKPKPAAAKAARSAKPATPRATAKPAKPKPASTSDRRGKSRK
jgi:TfoX/Sxy family transcriptional regulator of competence genes